MGDGWQRGFAGSDARSDDSAHTIVLVWGDTPSRTTGKEMKRDWKEGPGYCANVAARQESRGGVTLRQAATERPARTMKQLLEKGPGGSAGPAALDACAC